MTAAEIKTKIKEEALKLAAPALKSLPLLLEAIGAGVFISTVVDGHPGFKERLKELEGKVFLFETTDIGKRFHLRIKGGEINIIPHVSIPPDVTMRGEVEVFVNLFMGRVDPDTVFFSRKLEINGDTAAAIHLKNILASVF
ncbi:MAG: SCP2 sterol-binding domain-containing protein [Deltaproteobacteria bacterium]|nr:SCP2 sterol-binding domain-containing protein [Deltaproteobacteria bacterium]